MSFFISLVLKRKLWVEYFDIILPISVYKVEIGRTYYCVDTIRLTLPSDKALPKHSAGENKWLVWLSDVMFFAFIDYWPLEVSSFVHAGVLFKVKWIWKTELRLPEHGPALAGHRALWFEWSELSDGMGWDVGSDLTTEVRPHAISIRRAAVGRRIKQYNNPITK